MKVVTALENEVQAPVYHIGRYIEAIELVQAKERVLSVAENKLE